MVEEDTSESWPLTLFHAPPVASNPSHQKDLQSPQPYKKFCLYWSALVGNFCCGHGSDCFNNQKSLGNTYDCILDHMLWAAYFT